MATRHPHSDPILTTAVPVELAQAIRELARRDDRTTSAYIRRLLAAHVRQHAGAEAGE